MKKLDKDIELNRELHRICNMDLPESELIDKKLDAAYGQIYKKAEQESKTGERKNRKNMKTNRFLVLKLAAMAAGIMIAILGGIGVANPALAVDIPVIGRIFAYLEEKVSYPGDYSENTMTVGEQDQENSVGTEGAPENEQEKGNEYVQSKNGLTVAVTEFSRDSDKLYLALRITNEEGFPADFVGEASFGQLDHLQCNTSAVVHKDGQDDVRYSEGDGNIPLYNIEGEFQDQNTFVGIAMVEFGDLTGSVGIDFTFHTFYGLLPTTHEVEGHVAGETETIMIPEHDRKVYEGPWSFHFALDGEGAGQTEEIIVDQKNEDGFGISKVVRSAYEITAEPVLPDGEDMADYIVSILDADGNPLESHGGTVEEYSTYGRNTDTVTICLMKFETWLEYKGEHADKQIENAVFSVTVDLK